jgi:hypothetical protein
MTRIRSWMVEVTAFGVVVRTEQVLIQLPLRSFQPSYNPANANKLPFVYFKTERLLTSRCFLPFVKTVRRN